MFKRILIIILLVLALGAIGAYFFFSTKMSKSGRESLVCTQIDVLLLDSLDNVFINKNDIADMVKPFVIGETLDSIDTHFIEETLAGKDVIAKANAYIKLPNILTIEITQRKPIVRFQRDNYAFYSDENGFILPLSTKHPLNLPVVTGVLPIDVDRNYRGYTNNQEWMDNIISITNFIRNNAYWSEEIEQVNVESNGDLVFYPKGRDFKVIFGGFDDQQRKFEKLATFYKAILPDESKNYSIVNLKFKDQIVCK